MRLKHVILIFFSLVITGTAWCQCAGIMEPGFQFLTSSRGCAPFTVQIETLYLAATPGTRYFVNWGDGTPEQLYTQVGATGVTISHTYPNSPVDCGYDIIIDAENTCNPRGSVVPIETQVVVWTNDVISIDPVVFRVCQGYATDVLFTDNSDWNCYPRATRENNEARWIQWIYGTGVAAIRIPGVRVNSILPGSFPYFDPTPGRNPIYPVFAPGEVSLPINVPVTVPADIGREFEITLKNWNQCNPYDNNVVGDGNPFNPVNGDLVNGDNTPQLITARIVIVDAPQPDYITRLNNSTGPVQTVFCVGDDIYFDNETPAIAGAGFAYRWEFFDNSTGAGSPIATRTSINPTFTYNSTGQKLIRLNVRDNNAAGNCEAIYDAVITISPSLIAQISVTDFAGNPITPDFCQEANSPFTTFEVRFNDASIGAIAPTTQWRWEFYDPTNALVLESPTGGGFSNTQPGPFDRTFTTPGVYRALLRIRDNLTSCETNDEVLVRVFPKPQPDFSFQPQCEGQQTIFTDRSTLNPISSEQIVLREWDLDYDGTTFSKDPAFDNQTSFGYIFPSAGTYNVALRVTTDQGCSAEVFKVVTVTPTPNADFTPDRTSGCSTLEINFTNNSISGQPDIISEYRWEVDSGTGFQVDSIQHPNDPGFSSLFTRNFINNGTSNIDYRIRLRVITVNDCERLSAPVTITVFPGPVSGFSALNYSPFNDNCSPVPVSFSVDAQTQSLNPSDYTWTVADGNGIVDQISTGTTPAFSYTFNNNTQAL